MVETRYMVYRMVVLVSVFMFPVSVYAAQECQDNGHFDQGNVAEVVAGQEEHSKQEQLVRIAAGAAHQIARTGSPFSEKYPGWALHQQQQQHQQQAERAAQRRKLFGDDESDHQ